MDTMKLGEKYYQLLGQKDLEGIEKFLHPDVKLLGPLASLQGKEEVLQSISHFMSAFTSLIIRSKFGSVDQAMIVYDVDMPGVVENFPSASLLSFQDGQIVRIELFFDGSRFLNQ